MLISLTSPAPVQGVHQWGWGFGAGSAHPGGGIGHRGVPLSDPHKQKGFLIFREIIWEFRGIWFTDYGLWLMINGPYERESSAMTPKNLAELEKLLEMTSKAHGRWATGKYILTALEAAGLAVVPAEPTKKMIDAYRHGARGAVGRWCLKAYYDLLAASPFREPDK